MNSPRIPRPEPAHQIELLSWSSRARDRQQAQAHQARLSRFLNGPGLATIARVFSRASPPGEVWQLDTLEIDTGPLAADGSFSQWADCLAEQLWTQLLRARQQLPQAKHSTVAPSGQPARLGAEPPALRPRASSQHALENFLYYLVHGHLPWSVSPLAGRELSGWLSRLAQRTGPRLWTLLQQLRPGDYVLARLSQITPHQGLQALLAVRHRELADSLLLLDAQILAPLQARGRLSAYQLAQLQQAWRVAGLQALWGQRGGNLSADRLRHLQQALAEALVRQLGLAWRAHWRPLRHAGQGSGGGAELGQLLLSNLLGQLGTRPGQRMQNAKPLPGRAPQGTTQPGKRRPEPVKASTRLQEQALHSLLAGLNGDKPLGTAALLGLLQGLARQAPQRLQTRLQVLALQRDWRLRQTHERDPGLHWQLMLALAGQQPAPGDAERQESQASHWQETLRQFALAALAQGAQPAAGQGAGLSALQAWLQDYSLRQLALGQPMPRDARGWARLWRAALAEWQVPAPPQMPDGPASEQLASSPAARPGWPTAPNDAPVQAWRLTPRRFGLQHKPATSADTGPWLTARRQTMHALAARSTDLPPSLWAARWQAQLRQDRAASTEAALSAHLQRWQAELADTHSGLAHASSAPSAAATPGGTSLPSSEALWCHGLRYPLAQRKAALAPYLESQAWCWQVAQHWSRQRKQELLVLLSAPPLAAGQDWHVALARWDWLPAAIADCARCPSSSDTHRRHGWRDKALQDWLWLHALQWVYQQDEGSAQPTALYAHWLARAGLTRPESATPLDLPQLRARLWQLRAQRPPAPAALCTAQAEANHATLAEWLAQALAQLLPDWSAARRKAWHGQLLGVAGADTQAGQLARRYAATLAARLPQRFASAGQAMQALASALRQVAARMSRPNADAASSQASAWLAHLQRGVLQAMQTPPPPQRSAPATAQPPLAVAVDAAAATPDQALALLARFAALPASQRGWLARQQLQRSLATPALCVRWLACSNSRQRWSLLAALFPADIRQLRTSSSQLLASQALLLPQRNEAARLASHWAFLVDYLFLSGLPIQADLLQRRYAVHLCREDRTDQGARSASLARWLWRLGQALAGSADPADTPAPGSQPHPGPGALRRPPSLLEQQLAQQALPLQGDPAHPATAPARPAGQTDCHYLDNAGLVLLASYAQRLFGMLELLDGKTWRDAAAQAQAVRCLAYLVDGHEQGSEPEWVLPKLLCGMPQAQALLDTPGLSEATRATLDGLLQAVIAHWRALGSTSPDGLRQTFLQREGRLTHERAEVGQHWQLAVKSGPFDMLLDRLPWSYSTIKLPWMHEVLYVDWR